MLAGKGLSILMKLVALLENAPPPKVYIGAVAYDGHLMASKCDPTDSSSHHKRSSVTHTGRVRFPRGASRKCQPRVGAKRSPS